METKKFIIGVMIALAFVSICAYSTIQHNRLVEKGVYLEDECPLCGGIEVLNFGFDHNGNTKVHCSDCGADFTIEDGGYDEDSLYIDEIK